MNEKPKTDPVSLFKTAIAVKAAEALLAELTPEKMREIVEQILKEALGEISSSKYTGVGGLVHKAVEDATKEYLQSIEARKLIRDGVEAGVGAAFEKESFSAEVKGRVVDVALKGLTTSLAERLR